MAIGDDFSVNVAGDIRHVSGATNYTVLELHRWLQDLADDKQGSGNDLIDITSATPSDRATNSIITLNSPYNIDDDAAENLFGGSITQLGGDTVYSGLQVLGAVNLTSTQLMVIQDGGLYQFTPTPAAPFWGDQVTPYNGGGSVLMRILVKTRENGVDIDGKRIRVQAHEWFDSFAFFNATLGDGESVAAVSTGDDPQNTTVRATVDAYTHVLNSGGTANAPVGGFQLIDLNNGAGNKEYLSSWTFGADGPGAGTKGIYEYHKAIAAEASTKTAEGINGELWQGLTHEVTYNTGVGTFQEQEELVWGTDITYNTLVSGPFTPGNLVTIGTNGASGRVMFDDGAANLIVALDDPTITLITADAITEFSGPGAAATSTTAAINVTILNNADEGGSGIIIAHDDNTGTGEFYISLRAGLAPVTTLPLLGVTSAATAATNGAPVVYTVPQLFTGTFTGNWIGSEGVGFDATDLVAADSINPLDDVAQNPPNNVTFTVNGLVSGEDRVLVAPRTGTAINFAQDTHTALLTDGTSATMVMTTAIPLDTPTLAGSFVRIEDDNGVYVSIPYQSFTGSTYTFTGQGTGFFEGSDASNSAALNNVFVAYIDELASGASASFTAAYQSDRDLFVRVRDGGAASPIKTFELDAVVLNNSTSQTVTAIRTPDA